MKTYPIIFSGTMVRAILEGRKTQTRRLVTSMWANAKMRHDMGERILLYVRETWAYVGTLDPGLLVFQADYPRCVPREYQNVPPTLDALRQSGYRWKPCIHMPRKLSRLTLVVTDIRIQHLQKISVSDAIAEGVTIPVGVYDGPHGDAAIYEYMALWDRLHREAGYPSELNPEVIALTFRVHHCNIDEFIKQKTA
jgi:hypothetical protein